MSLQATDLTDAQFGDVSQLVYRLAGIHLKSNKKALVRSRLMKRLRSLGLATFDEDLNLLSADTGKAEISSMIRSVLIGSVQQVAVKWAVIRQLIQG